jgi:2-dehydropantoate 2-reductase
MATRIAIVGCGAIGALYAAHLAALPELEVWAYDTAVDHVEAIEAAGLRVTGHTHLHAHVRATTDPAVLPACAFGIVATKGTVTRPAIAATAAAFADAAVCSVQNGIGNEEILAEYVPRVMRGVTLPSGHLLAPGVVHMDAPGMTWIGPFEPAPARLDEVQTLADLLIAAGMPARALADARGPQWTKLLFNAATNPLCALTGLTHGQLCTLPATRAVVGELLREGEAVARALGIALDGAPGELVDEAARTNPDHRPSMLQDVLARQATEIATLNGGVVAAAREAGVPAPLHEAIVGLVRGLEHGWPAT